MRTWITALALGALMFAPIQSVMAGDNNTVLTTFIDAQAATSNQNSGLISMNGYSSAGLQISFAGGTPNGTITVQSSADGTNFDTMPGITPIVVTSTALQQVDITSTSWAYLRINWVNTSSTGGTTITMKSVRKNY